MAKNKKVWVNSTRTKTASDVDSLGECDALIRRANRNMTSLKEQGAHQPDAPPRIRDAYLYQRIVLRQLQDRRQELPVE